MEELKCKVCGKLASEDSHFYSRKMLCNRHYIQMYRYGRIIPDEEIHASKFKPEDRVCCICGDTKSSKYYTWHYDGEYKDRVVCLKHYAQLRLHQGQPLDNMPSLKSDDVKICQVCGSDNKVKYSKLFHGMFCLRHYSQLYNLGKLKEETIFDRNKYIINGDTTEIILKDGKFNETGRAIIDTEDLDKIIQYKWTLSSWGYAQARSNNGDTLLMQRVVLDEYSPSNIPDHIDRNPLNNCKSNLRIANKSDNAANSSLSTNNTSGVKGVSWNKNANAWRAFITKDGVRHELGHTKDFNAAVKKRLLAEKELFGEFAPQQYLYKEYGINE